MATHSKSVKERHSQIIEALRQAPQVKVSDLAKRFHVSTLTIRRDLDNLSEEGLIRRVHGSAELIDPLGSPLSSHAILAKRDIAKRAAQLIEDGDTVFINTSSTALSVIEYITASNVTIVTNNGKVFRLSPRPTISIILTGGEIRQPKWSMSGEFALSSIRRIYAAKAILGCSGFSASRGLTTLVSHETSINSIMLDHSDMHIVVADCTKIGINSSFRYGSPDQVDVLVTDEASDKHEVERLKQAGVRMVIYAEESE